MAPFISKASMACWRSCQLFLVRKLMLWRVSWGRCWNAMPTSSPTMPVARQLPSRLRQCGAKSARRAPTWDPSTLSGCGRWRNLDRLLASLEGSWMGPSGASSKGRLLCDSPLRCGWRGAQPVKHWRSRSRLLGWCLRAGLDFFLLGESHWWACHPISLSDGLDTRLKDLWFRTHHMVTFKRSTLQRELGAGNWSSWGGHHNVTTAGWTPLQNPQTPQKLEPLGWWSTSIGEVSCAHPWEKVLQSLKPPSNPPEMCRWRTFWPTPRCPNIHDVTNGMKMGSCCQWIHGHLAA